MGCYVLAMIIFATEITTSLLKQIWYVYLYFKQVKQEKYCAVDSKNVAAALQHYSVIKPPSRTSLTSLCARPRSLALCHKFQWSPPFFTYLLYAHRAYAH
jgi:hypothetical protein